MTNKEFISHERYLASTCSGYTPYGVEQLLDRLEAHLEKQEDYWKETIYNLERRYTRTITRELDVLQHTLRNRRIIKRELEELKKQNKED